MRQLVILIFLVIFTFSLPAETYKKVQIYFSDRTELREIMRSDLGIDHTEIQSDKSIIVYLGEREYRLLLAHGYRHKVLIDDWQKYYRNRRKMTALEKQTQLQKSADNYNVTEFDLGSMGGFYTFDEIVTELDSMRAKYQNIISARDSIGHSIEGRPLWTVKISDNPDIDEDEPQVCFDALIHAREGASMAAVMYFMYYLLENYGSDSVVTYLVNNREIYFLPCLNPDGYEYNRLTDHDGGGMWRKNRRDNGDGSYGVDLNRNYSIAWGWDDSGSSPDGDDETYRGTAALSEPESRYFAEFIRSKHIRTHINYHTYSNIILYPWSYIPDPTPDADKFFEYARDMSRYNHYEYGGGDAIGYFSNGTQSDWMYGEQTEKNKIFSFVVEVGTSGDGFWPEENRIIPLAQANVGSNLYLCWLPGGFARISAHRLEQSTFLPGDSVRCDFTVCNRGLKSIDDIKVEIKSLSPFATIRNSSYNLSTLGTWEADTINGNINISPDTPAGEEIVLTAKTFFRNMSMDIDTVKFFVGYQTAIFTDSCNSTNFLWDKSYTTILNKWLYTSSDYHSPPMCFTDSKTGDYKSDMQSSLTLINPINLTGLVKPRLSFWTKYAIETNWDCGMVQISADSGSTWTSLKGIYTSPGSGTGTQIKDIPVYHGFQTNWVQEDIDLSTYAGQQILLRFIIKSDDYVEYDGWYIDDIRVYQYSLEESDIKSHEPQISYRFHLDQNYPNPFNPVTRISYQIERANQVNLSIYNLLGNKVSEPVNSFQQPGKYSILFNLNAVSPTPGSGIYFIVLKSGHGQLTRKMMILK